MKLKNQTKNVYLTTDLKEVKDISDKFLGLLKKSNSRSLMFKTRFGIHTLFLKTKIDVIVLDNMLRVRILKTLNPNRMFIYSPRFKIVVELPQRTVQKTGTEIGDQLKMIK